MLVMVLYETFDKTCDRRLLGNIPQMDALIVRNYTYIYRNFFLLYFETYTKCSQQKKFICDVSP